MWIDEVCGCEVGCCVIVFDEVVGGCLFEVVE